MKRIFYTLLLLSSFTTVYSQTYLIENFNYSTNDSLSANGWVVTTGGTTNAIRANATGLTYTGYAGSGVGNAASLTTSGQDLVRDGSSPVSSGSLYTSFLMNVTAAQATGDYFFSMIATGSTSAFFGRVFLRSVSTGFCKIGVSKAATTGTTPSESVVYQSDSLSLNTTYLVVLKYQFNTVSTTDDSVKVFVFSSGIPATEPAVGRAETIGGTNADATSLQRVLLRQGTATQAATVVVDGIRFNANWAGIALPVKWASFTAAKNADGSLLKWSTASETNNSHFEIQRSVDGKNFEAIGKVKGSGNSNRSVNYSFTDKEAATTKTTYYRLKQVDFDGKSEYSKTVSVVNTIAKAGIGATLPNPFNNDLNVTVNASSATVANIVIMDMIGKIHHTSTEQLQSGVNTISINTTDMPDGIYFVRVSYNGETYTQKVVKK